MVTRNQKLSAYQLGLSVSWLRPTSRVRVEVVRSEDGTATATAERWDPGARRYVPQQLSPAAVVGDSSVALAMALAVAAQELVSRLAELDELPF